jgi:hypothetical protein
MASVTVPGAGGPDINELFSNTNNTLLAQQISDALAAASKANTLMAVIAPGPGTFAPQTANINLVNELVLRVAHIDG